VDKIAQAIAQQAKIKTFKEQLLLVADFGRTAQLKIKLGDIRFSPI